ncbi:glycosyltransferase family 2 protein [Bacteroides timonensis]|uniref:glycosyltransferase family 2 protein n=1 Tax=Bacteroides timonensis TaxID=1470345 RepID=UPI0004AE1CD9|nr:glycosyltransferase family 2 protein [Bacteroides timonensis]
MKLCNPEISVIVPVYRVERCLPRCIESILKQSFRNFELLLIDDGSPDYSGEICEKYACKDKRIRVFHQKNAGVSIARNYGLCQAKGVYIVFVDSDDWVQGNYLKDLYDSASALPGNGLVIQGAVRITIEGVLLSDISLPDRYFSFQEIGDAFIKEHICEFGFPWGKLYKRSLIETFSIRFPENINYYEDMLFMYQYLLHCDYLLLGHAKNYVYVAYPFTSLSARIHPFESEYACWTLYQELLKKMITVWPFDIDKTRIPLHLKMLVRRILKSDYQVERRVPKNMRIRHLKDFVSQNSDVVKESYYYVYGKNDRLGRYLLLSRHYVIYDLYIRILYYFIRIVRKLINNRGVV